MKIFTGELSKGKIKGVYLDKRRKSFIFLNEGEFYPDNFAGQNGYISLDITNVIMHSVETPPLKSDSALETVIKSKLATQIEESLDNFKILYFKNKPASNENKFVFNVFLIEKKLTDEILPKNVIAELELLTLSVFSLSSFSNDFKDMYLLHFFADKNRTIVTLSINGVVEYMRYTSVPEYVVSEEDLKNFYYESFNLSYIYLKQTKRTNIDLLLLSGSLFNDSLVNDIYNFANIPLFFLNPQFYVKNIDYKIFNKNIIPIGNVLLNRNYDIRDVDLLYYKNFTKLSKYFMYILIIFNLFMGFIFIKGIYSYNKAKNIYEIEKENFYKRDITVSKSFNITNKELSYYINYIKILNSEKKFTFPDFINEIKPILEIHNFKNLSFKKNPQNIYEIRLKSSIYFNSFANLHMFKNELEKKIKIISKNIKVEDKSYIDFDNNSLHINIVLIKKVN